VKLRGKFRDPLEIRTRKSEKTQVGFFKLKKEFGKLKMHIRVVQRWMRVDSKKKAPFNTLDFKMDIFLVVSWSNVMKVRILEIKKENR
jgi:hypothetical protein